jgi:DNA-binding XRE family transcriptional regulator
MLASPNQIKAGRALISWSADDLAKRVGVQKTMISAIETGRSNGSIDLNSRIVYALQAGGVEFTNDGGVRPRQSKISIYKGEEGFKTFFDDVYEVAKTSETPDICLTNVNEAEYDRWLGSYEPVHTKRMADLKSVRLRVLMKEQDTHLTSTEYCEYRWVPSESFADVSFYIYGKKTAIVEFSKDNVLVTVIDNEAATIALRKMFDVFWNNASGTPNA